MNKPLRGLLLIIAVLTACSAEPVSLETPGPGIAWASGLPEFRADAPLTDVPTICYFTATWCGFCKEMERTTLANQNVRARLETMHPIRFDFDAQADLVTRFHVTGVPAFIAVNERGEEVGRAVGMMDPLTFSRWLDASKKRAAEVIIAGEKAKTERAWLAEQIAAGDPETKTAVQEKLFDLLARGDNASRDFAHEVLTRQSEKNLAIWVDGLARPDLAVRIACANGLRTRLQHDIAFDPWSPVEERRVAIAALREAIARSP